MKRTKNAIYYAIILMLLPLSNHVQGQQVVRVEVDTLACAGDTVRVRIGVGGESEVEVRNVYTTMSRAERAFLPDGQDCPPYGCSYRSLVTFSEVEAGATIESAEDVKFVRLNIEHSWVGDLFVGVVCPNGQEASLLNWSGNGTTPCRTLIPESARSWSNGTNASTSTWLGAAHDYEDAANYCDSTLSGNAPGTGWNYCWSENTTQGYQYAPGDGIIYRASNVTITNGHSTIDSSNVTQGRNFYRPNESFASLVGCPVAGTWYIEVIDGWAVDNGYVFDWELALDERLVPMGGVMTGCAMSGEGGVEQVNDTTFLLTAPPMTGRDTTVNFTATVYGTGRTTDTTVSIHFYSDNYRLVRDTICAGDTLRVDELVITDDWYSVDTMVSAGGCVSVREVDVKVNPSYRIYDTTALCRRDIFLRDSIVFSGEGDYTVAFRTAAGCDSTLLLHLTAADTLFELSPLVSDDGIDWTGDTMLAGCVPMRLMVRDTTPECASREWWFGDGATSRDSAAAHNYDSAGVYDVTLAAVSLHGCRDTVTLRQVVWTYQPPAADFWWTPMKPVASHPTAMFMNESIGTDTLTYLWEFEKPNGAGVDSSSEVSPRHTWGDGSEVVIGEWDVLLTAMQAYVLPWGDTLVCIDTADRTVEVVNDWLQFPNLVTPNGDGTNDVWKVVNLLECGLYTMNELWIYNAWGALVFHAKDISEEGDFWDPEKTRSPDGTYYYRFAGKSLYGLVRRTGMIEVVR